MGRLLTGFLHDLRAAQRLAWAELGTTGVIVLTLALGFGANTAVFSFASSMLMQDLPLGRVDTERLVQIVRLRFGNPDITMSVPALTHLHESAVPETFDGLAAYRGTPRDVQLFAGEGSTTVRVREVTASLFTLFEAQPLLGRAFTDEEDIPNGPAVAVLSHRTWQNRFGGDPDVVGSTLRIGNAPFQVVGVMPPSFRYPHDAEVWVPIQIDPASTENLAVLQVMARLREGVSSEAASEALAEPYEEFRRLHNRADHPERLSAMPFLAFLFNTLGSHLALLAGSALIVLILAAANVANLQLMRSVRRRQEMATRLALGASPGRIQRLLIFEALLVSLGGALLGLLFCPVLLRLMLAVIPSRIPIFQAVTINGTALAGCLGLVVVVGIVTGLVPGLASRQWTIMEALRAAGGTAGGGRFSRRWRQALVISECALAVVAMTASLLLLRSFGALNRIDPGLDPTDVVTMRLLLNEQTHGSNAAWERMCRILIPEIARLEGVAQTAIVTNHPLTNGPPSTLQIPGQTVERAHGRYLAVSPGYFRTLQIPVLRGRPFDERDHATAAPVVMVNQTLLDRYWPAGVDPLGNELRIGTEDFKLLQDTGPRRIVGIVSDVREDGLSRPPPPVIYVPMSQVPDNAASFLSEILPWTLMVKRASGGSDLSRRVREKIRDFDAALAVDRDNTLEAWIDNSVLSSRRLVDIVGMFTIVSLILSIVGIHGVLLQTTLERRREIGLRQALGASPRNVLLELLRSGLISVGLGVALGALATTALHSQLQSVLFEIEVTDPTSVVLAVGVVVTVACGALALPAWKAARRPPAQAIRFE